MRELRVAVEREKLQEGVFQPGRAQIAREMKCRLDLNRNDRPRREQRH